MALPNKKVIFAIIDSYINIRKDKWGLSIDDPEKFPLPEVEDNKRKLCIDLVRAANKAETLEDWRDLLFDISNKIRIEHENVKILEASFLGLRKWVMDRPLFLETLSAVRSYCISQLDSKGQGNIKKKFEMMKNNLLKEVESAKEEKVKQESIVKLAHLGSFRGYEEIATGTPNEGLTVQIPWYFKRKYHNLYNEQITQQRDVLAKELAEKSFEDFEANVISGKRKIVICNKFLKVPSKVSLVLEVEDDKKPSVSDAKSEMKPETKPEAKPEVKEIKSEVKPEAKAETKAETPVLSHAAIAARLPQIVRLSPIKNAPTPKAEDKKEVIPEKGKATSLQSSGDKNSAVKVTKPSTSIAFVIPPKNTRRQTRAQTRLDDDDPKQSYAF